MRTKAKKLTLVILPFLLILFYVFSGSSESNETSFTSSETDPIEQIPEWLKVVVENAIPTDTICYWIPTNEFESSSLIKVPRFPRTFSDKEINANSSLKSFEIKPLTSQTILRADVLKNERFSGQIALISKQDITGLKAKTSDFLSSEGDIISTNIKIRFVGYVPVQRAGSEFDWSAKYENIAGPEVSGTMNPDLVADPLLELDEIDVPSHRSQPLWFTIDIPKEAKTGKYYGLLSIQTDQFQKVVLNIELNVLNIALPDSKDYSFFLDLWLNANSIANQYHIPAWSEEHWNILQKYMSELASAGGKTITSIITHEPWRIPWVNGSMRSQTNVGYEGMIKWKLSTNGTWKFDYSIFDRYVETAMKSGLSKRINAYSLTSFRGKEKVCYYDEQTNKDIEIFFESVKDPEYKKIWRIFFSSFKSHLIEKKWLTITYLCFDERLDETMEFITKMLKEIAPEFSNRIAISGHPESTEFATGFLSISYEYFPNQNLAKRETLRVINDRNKSDNVTTFYLCGQPAHPNTLSYSPAVESRMIPWLALKYETQGYLRWSFNSWPKEPYTNPVFNFNQGDEYIIYPGDSGPVSSIRWELLKDGIEDFELYQLIASKHKSDSLKLSLAVKLSTDAEDGRSMDVKNILLARKKLIDIIP